MAGWHVYGSALECGELVHCIWSLCTSWPGSSCLPAAWAWTPGVFYGGDPARSLNSPSVAWFCRCYLHRPLHQAAAFPAEAHQHLHTAGAGWLPPGTPLWRPGLLFLSSSDIPKVPIAYILWSFFFPYIICFYSTGIFSRFWDGLFNLHFNSLAIWLILLASSWLWIIGT